MRVMTYQDRLGVAHVKGGFQRSHETSRNDTFVNEVLKTSEAIFTTCNR